jgi:pyruvate/2-oxoglutarate dehydrogenase complex dihydrolipoamide acyltransferase (E2) component
MRGRAISLSIPRRIIADMMYFAASVPTVAAQRRMQLAAVVDARAQCAGRPSWPAIFTKAHARVAQDMPELRRAYLTLPWPHLYEYPASVAHVAVERDYAGEPGVFGCVIKDPAALPLQDIDRRIKHAAQAPLAQVSNAVRAANIARLPLLVRRLLMWLGLSVGRYRANHFGTFAVSAVSSLGTDILTPLSVWTTLLNYGVLAGDGSLDVRIIFDHRAVDGATIARALARLEEVLTGSIVQELRGGPDGGSA